MTMWVFTLKGSLAEIPGIKSISMTTNGVTLSHKLAALQEAGLSAINVSLDTLHEKKFEFITRRRGWDKVMRGIDQALEAGIYPLKVHVHDGGPLCGGLNYSYRLIVW